MTEEWAGSQLGAGGQRKERPGVMGGRAAGDRSREMSKGHDGQPEDREFSSCEMGTLG